VGYMGEEIRGRSLGRRQQGALIQQNIILGGKLGLDRQIFTEAELGPMRERLINCT
jgi:outer membrane protein, heavy metal efflux system